MTVLLLTAGAATAPTMAEPRMALGVEPAGYAVYPIPTRGAELVWFASESSAWSVSGARGATERLLATYDADLVLARYKRRLSAVTHWNVGLGYRGITQRYAVDGEAGALSSRTSAEALVAETSLGNRLALGPVVLACDWIGLVLPVTRLGVRRSASGDIPEEEREANRKAFEQVADAPSVQLMRFSIGVEL